MNAVNAALVNKLTSGTALTSLLAAGTASIYHMQAGSATLPYVIFSLQGGGPDNLTGRDMPNLVYHVRAYADSARLAGSIDTAVSALLHKGTIAATGYNNFLLLREEDTELIENPPNSVPIFMAGGFYRVRISKT
jgi:hypothetical protein